MFYLKDTLTFVKRPRALLHVFRNVSGDLQNNIDQEMPSVKDKQLGRCKICPAYTFLSATEKKRHMSIFHPMKSAGSQRASSLLQVQERGRKMMWMWRTGQTCSGWIHSKCIPPDLSQMPTFIAMFVCLENVLKVYVS